MSDTTPTPSHGFGEAPLRPAPASSSFSRPAALIGGAVALMAATALATTLVLRPQPLAQADAGAAQAARTLALTPTAAPRALLAPAGPVIDGDDVPAAIPEPAPTKPAPVARTPARAPAAKRNAAAAVCRTCGVVAAVTAVRQKGEGSGVGAVGGAVVGGLLGNQVGDGNGRKAMTVLGAVGGGLAGNEIERRRKATTLYRVTVRMNDGTTRSVTQASAPVVGAKVSVDGGALRARG